ncbi:hypothetical protein PLUTE_b0278 [Pseudoalteromonas luteoviolacea DSM 6061]|nr:hypothetical protein [Pseudoalteromonas luteoviolacea DSM 6061]
MRVESSYYLYAPILFEMKPSIVAAKLLTNLQSIKQYF